LPKLSKNRSFKLICLNPSSLFSITLYVLPTCKSLFRVISTLGFIKQSDNQISPFSTSFNCFKCASRIWHKTHSQYHNHLIEQNQINHEIKAQFY